MSDEVLRRLAQEIELEGIGEMTALELQKLMFHAGIGLNRGTIEKYLKESLFASLLIPAAWKAGKGRNNVDKAILMNVSRWKRGSRFEEILGNGHQIGEVNESAQQPTHS
jgi:hypothetical protein